jgi:glycolate oxidase iron-sulfur subunit
MQTYFTPQQLADPQTAASEEILRTCVHCGFCTSTCPTYTLLGEENDSPRGRIYLIKDMLENDKPASPLVVKHIDRCLSCLSCMTTCPSGVHYQHLVDHAREHIEETYQRAWHDRALRALLAALLPYPNRFRFALMGAWLARPVMKLKLAEALPGRIKAMLRLAPAHIPSPSATERPGIYPAIGPRKARVAMLMGCAQPVLKPGINEATIRVLNRLGVEVVMPAGGGCCGALVHHMGKTRPSHAQAAANIEAWHRELQGEGLDAVIINASGCGTQVKDYGFMFRDDAKLAEKAKAISAITKDVTEFLHGFGLGEIRNSLKGLNVTYHSACSMQHGQQIKTEPVALLKQLGCTVKQPAEGHLCCGSAGIYNIMQPELSERLKARKLANIERTVPDVVATGNIGCITQLASARQFPVVHTIELIDWATGGEKPEGME